MRPCVQYGHVDVVEYLLEHASLPLDHRDSQGDTALIYAIQYVPICLSDG